jgi:hypothetical protein
MEDTAEDHVISAAGKVISLAIVIQHGIIFELVNVYYPFCILNLEIFSYNCGKTGHLARNCNSNNKKCYSCGGTTYFNFK